MKHKKLSDYDRSQDYIAISDYIDEKLEDHADDSELIKVADEFRALLGDKLDSLKTLPFSIYNSETYRKKYSKKKNQRAWNEAQMD